MKRIKHNKIKSGKPRAKNKIVPKSFHSFDVFLVFVSVVCVLWSLSLFFRNDTIAEASAIIAVNSTIILIINSRFIFYV